MSELERAIVTIAAAAPTGEWQPTVRDEGEAVRLRLPGDEGRAVLDQAVAILARSLPPARTAATRTGLVVGLIQSGKTMSFTTVAALARDNDIPIVIVVAGISELLLEQSRARLWTDLDLEREGYRRWQHFKSPDLSQRASVADVLAEWRDPRVPREERPTVLVTVMKNAAQLRKLAEMLERLELAGLTALLIDDEADQASLNTRWRQGDESSTYFHLLRVRRALPRHTLLQYTATPQAPLLLSLADSLSPDFTRVLVPGPDYVGGRDYFAAGSPYARILPQEDIAAADDPGRDPPAGLLHAMRVFFVGVAAGQLTKAPEGRRSMMVHPSQLRDTQAQYARWVRSAKDLWSEVLDRPAGDPSRLDLVGQFALAYDELRTTVTDLPAFEDLLSALPRWIRRTKVQTVNAARGRYEPIDWSSAYSWILIGGQLLDRGFTVEGLTTTYMPRDIGVGNADTLQQRARFYGYKRPYLPYCRVWLEPALHDALEGYVRHEQHMHKELTALAERNEPLAQWKRAFLLDPSLRPSRSAVLSMPHHRFVPRDEWYNQDFPHGRADAIETNRALARRLRNAWNPQLDPGHAERTDDQVHLVAGITVRQMLADLLAQFVVADGNDAIGYAAVLLQVAAFLDADPRREQEVAQVYWMKQGKTRARTLGDDGSVKQLFQGSNRDIYPGDRAVRGDCLSVQIHNLNLTGDGAAYPDVPTIAVWVPRRMRTGAILQAD